MLIKNKAQLPNGPYIGVDEAGRGTWAGPLCAAAVYTTEHLPSNIKDSKTMSRGSMEEIYEKYKNIVSSSISVITVDSIDEIGVGKAQALAQGRAIRAVSSNIKCPVVVDGNSAPNLSNLPNDLQIFMLPKADALISVVSLASIFAKVAQLRIMETLELTYPGYGFKKHAGYGTKDHQMALKRLGICPAHRKSFSPIKNFLEHSMNNIIDDISQV